MTKPFVLVQLSDPHLGGTWAGGDPDRAWRAAVDAVGRLEDAPDAVVVTGDLADHGADEEYVAVSSGLASLDPPVFVLPGNHDDRESLRRHFGLTGEPGKPVHYAVELGPLSLLALDTSKPGTDAGELGQAQLRWLDSELSCAWETPTLIAMHHPPFETGRPVWDAISLAATDRSELSEIVSRHPQVCGIVAGHVHRTIIASVGGTIAMSAPSTYVQGQLRFAATELEFTTEPPGFLVHTLCGAELRSHLQIIDRAG